MNQMKYTILLFFATVVSSFASLPLFDGYDFNSLHMIREIHSEMIRDGVKEKNPLLGGEYVAWSSIFLDKKENQISDRWVLGNEKPENYQKVQNIRLYIEKNTYDMSSIRKLVTIDEVSFDQMTMMFHLDGWYVLGINLDELVKKNIDNELEEHNDGMRSFRVKPPHIQHPTQIFINKENRVTKLIMIANEVIDGEAPDWKTIARFKWAKVSGSDFWYPEHQSSNTITKNKVHLNTDIWVREIKLNPALPKGIFEPEYPDDYRVIDRRKMIKPFGF